MKLVFKSGVLLLLLLGSTMSLRAETGMPPYKEFTKTIRKEFSITPNGTTSLYNKYGSIDVKTWAENRVKISVTIVVDASSESDAQEVFNRINIDFSNSDSYVKAETSIGSKKSNSWWSWGNTKSDYKIKYEVFLPATNQLDIRMEYGDVNAAKMSSTGKINVKYGNFRIGGFGANATVSLEYGNGIIEQADDISGTIRYSQFRCNQAKNLDVTSEYSTVTVAKGRDVISNSKYDNYDLGEVREFRNNGKYDNIKITSAENITVASQYTEVKAKRIANNVDLTLKYGGASIDQVAKGFNTVVLNGNYTDFKVMVEDGATYRLEASADYAGITYPQVVNVTFEKERGVSHEVSGYVGTQNARSVIKAKLDYGGLKVRQQ